MALLKDIHLNCMLSLLTQNPNTVVYGLTSSDYPNGITRAALLAAFQLKVQNNALYDPATGKWNMQAYVPGILVSAGEQITGGLQDNETYQPNANGVKASSLPVSSPSNVLGAPATGAPINTGTIGSTTGEFSPPGDCGAVATKPIVSAVSPGVAFSGSPAIVNAPSQVV